MKRFRLAIPIVAVISCAVAVCSGTLGWVVQFIVSGLTYFGSGLFVGKRRPRRPWEAAAVLGPYLLLYGAGSLLARSVQTYPIWIFGALCFALGYLASRTSGTKLGLVVASHVAFASFGGRVFMDNWLSYVFNRDAETRRAAPDYNFLDDSGRTIPLHDLRGKLVVLDFWSTGCGFCFDKFPEFESFYQRHSRDPTIAIYAVNLMVEGETIEQNHQLIRGYGYTFPVIYAGDADDAKARFNLRGVPTIVIVDRFGMTRYRGGLYGAPHVLVNNIESILGSIRGG